MTTDTGQPNNWGRWGDDDERGALNLITQDVVKRAVSTVELGATYSLAVPLKAGEGPIFEGRTPLQHFMTRHGGDYAAGLKEKGFGFADDYILVATHGTSHIDALAHVWRDGLMWNGYPSTSVTSIGARRCGIQNVGSIVTRAILVDFAEAYRASGDQRYPIDVNDLAAAVEATGIDVLPGDALLVRTGWLGAWRDGQATEATWPGLAPNCSDWINERGFALVGADNLAVELGPSPRDEDAAPLHARLVRDFGIYLAELLDLDEVAAAGRSAFMLTIAPMPLVNGVGSPVNPVAVL